METIEEANDQELVAECEMSGLKASQTAPDQGQTNPDQGQTNPDQGQTAPDQGQTNPDQGQTAPDQGQTAPDQGQTAPDQGQTNPDQGQTAPDQGPTAPDQGQTKPDQGQTNPDQGQTAPDQGQTNPDQGQTANEPEPQHQGEGSGPFVAWLTPTADRPPRKDLAQAMGNLKVRVKGLRPKDPRTPEPSQLPNVPDRPPTKELAQVMGNLRFRVKGLRKLRVDPGTTSRLEEERPLGRPSGRSPFPGHTAPDPSQIPEEPDRAPRKDLSQVMGNVRVRVRALREQRVETATTALPDQEEQDVVIEAEEEGEATKQDEGKGLRPRISKWLNLRMKDLSTFAARFHCGSYVR
ncbi:unnamed protein product [Arctogadus glacialis]